MGNKLTIDDIAEKMSEQKNEFEVPKCKDAIQIILDEVKCGIKAGERTEVRGFGVFTPVVYEPSPRRNPRTGESISMGYRGGARFKASKALKSKVSN